MNTSVQAAVTEAVVLRRDAGGVATLTLNRPSQFNALSREMLTALQNEIDRINADRSVRVVVIAGAGKAFCAGHDLKEMRASLCRASTSGCFAQRLRWGWRGTWAASRRWRCC